MPPVHPGFRPTGLAPSRSAIPARKGLPTAPGFSSSPIGGGLERRFPRLRLAAIALYKFSTMASPHCIRLARIEEASALSELCIRSKAVWGYDEAFMALARIALEVRPEQVAAGDVWVATGADGEVAGMVALAPSEQPNTLDLDKLFVEPQRIRNVVGRAFDGPCDRRSTAPGRQAADNPLRPLRGGLLRTQWRAPNW